MPVVGDWFSLRAPVRVHSMSNTRGIYSLYCNVYALVAVEFQLSNLAEKDSPNTAERYGSSLTKDALTHCYRCSSSPAAYSVFARAVSIKQSF